MEYSWQAYWNGLPFPSPGDLSEQGIELRSPTLQADSLSSEPPGKPPEDTVQCCAVLSYSVMSDSVTPWTVAHQAPLSMGILQARILEWVAMSSPRGSPQLRDQTQVSCIAGGYFTI